MPAREIPPGSESLHLPAGQYASLGERIGALHSQLRRVVPAIDRMACALYDPGSRINPNEVTSFPIARTS